jgi:hypothetical protein
VKVWRREIEKQATRLPTNQARENSSSLNKMTTQR